MKKSLDKEIQMKQDLENGIVCGIKVKHVPRVGMGCETGVNGDSYGYQVIEVADDGSWFTYGHKRGNEYAISGTAALVTRKNSYNFGRYREARQNAKGVWVPTPTCRGVRCECIGNVYLTGEYTEPKTILDPSF